MALFFEINEARKVLELEESATKGKLRRLTKDLHLGGIRTDVGRTTL